jgi:hypothetical protein
MKVFCIFFMTVNMYGAGIQSLLENTSLNLIIRIFLVKKKMWFFGILPTSDEAEFFPSISLLCFQFCIWEAKLGKKIPSFHTLEISFSEQIECLLRLNKDARESATKTNISLCRQFGFGYRPAANLRAAHPAGPPDGPPAVHSVAPQELAAPGAAPAPAPGRWIPLPPRERADLRPPLGGNLYRLNRIRSPNWIRDFLAQVNQASQQRSGIPLKLKVNPTTKGKFPPAKVTWG